MWVIMASGSCVIALLPIAYALGTVFIDGTVKPFFIPAAEIEALASDLTSRFDDPEGAALIEEHAAWYRSDNFAQGTGLAVDPRLKAEDDEEKAEDDERRDFSER